MGLFGSIGSAISGAWDKVTDTANDAWETVTPWNDETEGALGIGKVTPFGGNGNLFSWETLGDAATLAAMGYGANAAFGGSSGGLFSGGLASDATLSATPTLSEQLAANSVFSPTSTAGAGLLGAAGSGAGSAAGLTGMQKGLLALGGVNALTQGVGMFQQAQAQNQLAKQQQAWNEQQQENYDKTNYMGYTPKYDYQNIIKRGNSDPTYRAGAVSAMNRIKAMRGA